MQVYLIVKGHIDLIENATVPTRTKPDEWNQIVCATIRMNLSESVYYTVQLCATAHALWATLLSTYEKKAIAMKLYQIRCLYNLQMKESDSVTTHLSAYETLIAQLSSQGMTIQEELRALTLLSQSPFVMGNFRNDYLQCHFHRYDLCICYRSNTFRTCPEKVIRAEYAW